MAPLIFNGTTITGDYTVKYGNTELTKIIYNGQTVWEKNTSKVYRYKAKAARYGKTSMTSPSSAGNFSVSGQAGVWYFLDTTDVTGYNTTLSTCMGKTITDMKFFFYRTNTYPFNQNAGNTAWTYNVQVNNSGVAAVWYKNNSYYYDQVPATPTAAGIMNSGLTTAQLKNIFASGCRKQYTDTAGSGCNQLTPGYYYSFGIRCQNAPSGQIMFRCNNIDYDDAYIEITATG